MASNHTQTYGLNQWSLSDGVIMSDFNEDNQKTEQALLALKAELKEGDQKIEQTLTAALPKFVMGSYTGTGTYGAENPTSLTFDFEPKLLIIAPLPVNTGNLDRVPGAESMCTLVAIRGASTFPVSHNGGTYNNAYILNLDWNNKTVSWHSLLGAFLQYNDSAVTYRYLAIG